MIRPLLSILGLVAISTGAVAQIIITNPLLKSIEIPDANFKAALVANTSINTNENSEISLGEAIAFTGTMDVSSKGISDLTGIEKFTKLDRLYCQGNELSSIDLTENIALTLLNCEGNELSSLDLAQNTAITKLNCSNNDLTSLDVTKLTVLSQLTCQKNKIGSLDLSQNNVLSEFDSRNNKKLMCIEVKSMSQPTSSWFKDMQASYNTICGAVVNIPDVNFKSILLDDININPDKDGEITVAEAEAFTGKIDVSEQGITDLTGIEAFTALTVLNCNHNLLTFLDVTQNTALTKLSLYNNLVAGIDLTQNTKILTLDTRSNANLKCIKVNDLDQPYYTWYKDSKASYSTVCEIATGLFSSQVTEVLNIYPNPSTSIINTEAGQLDIFDVLGNQVLSTVSTGKVDVSGLDSGIYLISLNGKRTTLIIE